VVCKQNAVVDWRERTADRGCVIVVKNNTKTSALINILRLNISVY